MRFCSLLSRCVATSVLVVAGVAASAAAAGSTAAAPSGFEAFVDSLVAARMTKGHVPGLVVVVVRDGRPIFAKGYGMADMERRLPMTPATGLRVGSLSKPVSAAAVMMLVQDGKLALDAPIDRYVRVDADAFGAASTVAQLLTMTAGYSDDVLQVHVPAESRSPSLGEFLERRRPVRRIQPGIMSYSSWNLALLGHAIETIEHEPFDRVVARRVFAPLGMVRSTFAQPASPPLLANLAIGYGYESSRFVRVPYDQVPLSPGIGLVTTGEDMGRFMTALTSGASPILNESTLRGLLQRQAGVHPLLRGRSYAFSESSFGPSGTLYHDGNGIGFGSRMIIVPAERLGIFVSANHRALDRSLEATPAFLVVREVAVEILDKLAPAKTPDSPLMKPMPAAAGGLERYTGEYQAASMPRDNLMKIGMLLDVASVRANGDGTLSIGSGRYAEIEPGLFQNQKQPNIRAAFRDGRGGTIRYLSFGGTGTYERVPWIGRLGVQLGIDVLVVALSFAVIVLWVRRRTTATATALASSVANVAFLAGFVAYMKAGDLLLLFKTIPLPLRLVLLLPWISALFAAAMLAATVMAGPRFRQRVALSTLTTVASALLAAQVVYWRLLPW